ncbi:ArsR/SmtB family transcription factor [Deinococcus aestuarii]|uniref:ArsR/SmtB family transcription factor n=1 Tax=Deinococcus aestuarii TaxID=2774531 RepID=UPI001C0DEB0C|nr:metalloregulator ArsR/SmtB family transcription factor [Deinococcus aestuarii]
MRHHPLTFPPDAADLAHVTGLFQALADPTRLTLLLALRDGERTVTDLGDALGQPQSTVSRHLATLRHARLVRTRRDGPRVYYRLADAHLTGLLTQAFSHAQHERLGLPDHSGVEIVKGDAE